MQDLRRPKFEMVVAFRLLKNVNDKETRKLKRVQYTSKVRNEIIRIEPKININTLIPFADLVVH